LPEGWGLRRYGRTGGAGSYVFFTPLGKRLTSVAELEREMGWAPPSLKGHVGVTDALRAALAANKSKEEAAADAGLPAGWKAAATIGSTGRPTYAFTAPDGRRVRSVKEVEMILGRSVVAAVTVNGQNKAAVAGVASAEAQSKAVVTGVASEGQKKSVGMFVATSAERSAAEAAGLPAGWGLRKFDRSTHFLMPSGKKLNTLADLENELGWVPASLKGDKAITEAIFAACEAGFSEEETAIAAGFPAGWKVSASRRETGKASYSYISPDGKKVTGLRAVEDIIGRPLVAALGSKPPQVDADPVQTGTGGVKRKGSGCDEGMDVGEEQHDGYKLRCCPDQQDACDILPDDVEAVDLEAVGAQIEASGWKRMLREQSHHTFSGAAALSLHECGKLVVSSRERQLVHSIGRQLADTWLAVE